MSQIKLIPFDPAKYLTTSESQAELLTDAFETNDAVFIENAFKIVARARGFSEENQSLNAPSIVAMLSQMNLRLDLKPAPK
jgi:DNA-binding phage protein